MGTHDEFDTAKADPDVSENMRRGIYSVAVAERFLDDPDPSLAVIGADHPLLVDARLVELAQSSSPYRRYAAASSSRTPPDTLASLANDEDPRVREAVAANPSSPSAALAQLLRDDAVRAALLSNHAVPQDLLGDVHCDDVSAAVTIGYLHWRSTGRLGPPTPADFHRVNESVTGPPAPGETLAAYATRQGFAEGARGGR